MTHNMSTNLTKGFNKMNVWSKNVQTCYTAQTGSYVYLIIRFDIMYICMKRTHVCKLRVKDIKRNKCSCKPACSSLKGSLVVSDLTLNNALS